MMLVALIAVVFVGVFAVIMATYSSQREVRSRREELRRRLGTPQDEDSLYDDELTPMGRWLAESGLGWAPRLLVARSLTAAAAGTLLGVVFGGPLMAFVGGCVGGLIFPATVHSKRRERLDRCNEQLPQALQIMVLALRAGHALPGALSLAAREAPNPIREELKRAVDEHTLGRPLGQVVENFAMRLPNSDTAQTFAVAVLVLEQTGGNLIGVLDRIVDNSRAIAQYRAKLNALTAQGKWSARILSLMPFGFATAAALMDPNYLPSLLNNKMLIVVFFIIWIPGRLITSSLVRSAERSG